MRWLKRIVLTFTGLLSLGVAGAWWMVHRQLPDGAAPAIPGLASRVQVAFDARGVATIRNGTTAVFVGSFTPGSLSTNSHVRHE